MYFDYKRKMGTKIRSHGGFLIKRLLKKIQTSAQKGCFLSKVQFKDIAVST